MRVCLYMCGSARVRLRKPVIGCALPSDNLGGSIKVKFAVIFLEGPVINRLLLETNDTWLIICYH